MRLSHRALIPIVLICFLSMASEITDATLQGIALSFVAVLSFIAIGMAGQKEF